MSAIDLKVKPSKLARLSLVPLIKTKPQEESLLPQDQQQEYPSNQDKTRSPIEYLRGTHHKKRLTSQAYQMSISTNPNSHQQMKSSTFLSGDVCFYSKNGSPSPTSNKEYSCCAQDKISEQQNVQYDNEQMIMGEGEEEATEIQLHPGLQKQQTVHKRNKATLNFNGREQENLQEKYEHQQKELKMNNFVTRDNQKTKESHFVPSDLFSSDQQSAQKRIICDLDDISSLIDDNQQQKDKSIILGKINQIKLSNPQSIVHIPSKVISPKKIQFVSKQATPQMKPPLSKFSNPELSKKNGVLSPDDSTPNNSKRPASRSNNRRVIIQDKTLQQRSNNNDTIYTFLEDSTISAKHLYHNPALNSLNSRDVSVGRPIYNTDLPQRQTKYSCFLEGSGNVQKYKLIKKRNIKRSMELSQDESHIIEQEERVTDVPIVKLKAIKHDSSFGVISQAIASPFKQGFVNQLPTLCDEDQKQISQNVLLMNKRQSKQVKMIHSRNIFNLQRNTTSNVSHNEDPSCKRVMTRQSRNTFYKFMNKMNASQEPTGDKSLQRVVSVESH